MDIISSGEGGFVREVRFWREIVTENALWRVEPTFLTNPAKGSVVESVTHEDVGSGNCGYEFPKPAMKCL